jgi:hypothetical protein
MPKPRPTYLLTLADARPDDPDAGPIASRLRRALKVLLRSFDLRCVRIAPGPAPPPGTSPEPFRDAGEGDGPTDVPDATQPALTPPPRSV